MISACSSLMRSLNRGNIEGTNGLKIVCLFYVCEVIVFFRLA